VLLFTYLHSYTNTETSDVRISKKLNLVEDKLNAV